VVQVLVGGDPRPAEARGATDRDLEAPGQNTHSMPTSNARFTPSPAHTDGAALDEL
jgi:hypothetical protein